MGVVPLIDARIRAMKRLTPAIVEFLIEPVGEMPSVAFAPGAHILCGVRLPDGAEDTRAYSLIGAAEDRSGYRIAVQKEPDGKGGSVFMHELTAGASLRISAPKNDFPLVPGATDHVLIAGGIGVTPIFAMARALAAAGERARLYYVGRDRAAMAYADEVVALGGVVVVDGGDPSHGLDLPALLDAAAPGRHAYVCGPRGLVLAVQNVARSAGWADENVHFELFSAEAARTDDASFEVELRQSGLRLRVPADRSILEEMIAAGLDPLFDCRRGECGLCVVPVLEGVPDHRDMNLSAREKAEGRVICTCVSRAKTPLLVLDA